MMDGTVDRLQTREELSRRDELLDLLDPGVIDFVIGEVRPSFLEQVTAYLAGKRFLRPSAGAPVRGVMQSAIGLLGINAEIDIVFDSQPTESAAIVPVASDSARRGVMVVSEELARSASAAELRFLVGHELTHFGLAHDETRWILETLYPGAGRMPARVGTAYRLWAAYAEISADRGGALCAGSSIDTSRALHRYAGHGTPDVAIRTREADRFLKSWSAGDAQPPALDSEPELYLGTHPDISARRVQRFLLLAGQVVAAADANVSDPERDDLMNFLAEWGYAGPGILPGWTATFRECSDEIVSLARELRDSGPELLREVFTELARLSLTDGQLRKAEYSALVRLGSEILGMDHEAMIRAMLSVLQTTD